MRMRCRGGHSCQEDHGQEFLPSKAVTQPAQDGIGGVTNFFTRQAPERRFPEHGVLSPKDKTLPKQAVHTKSARYRDKDARVAPEVVAADGNRLATDERQVDRKSTRLNSSHRCISY